MADTTTNSNGGGYTAGTGASTPEQIAYFKQLRGEKLTGEDWKALRESGASATDIYDVAPF